VDGFISKYNKYQKLQKWRDEEFNPKMEQAKEDAHE